MAQRRWCFAHSESTRRTNWPCIYWTNTVALFSLVAMRSRHVLHWQSRRPNWRRQSRSLSVDTIMRHPMLQVGMVDATSKTPSWIQLQSLDLTQHIKWLYIGGHDDFEQTVQEIFRTQLDDRFPDLSIKQPGWKITVIRQGNDPIMEVLLTWNHPQFDGAGAKVFHEDFLEMLNADNGACERTGLDGDILRLPQAAPLLPTPIESLKSLPVDLKYLAKRWSIDRAQFGLSTEIPAAAMEFSPVSVAGRGMCVSTNWPDCAVDATFGQRIMADLERWLAQLASQS
ncbi:hypothetical protein M406DRAFT_333270 [Cryphonectria parasitica EP155]|uniref:Uncharacterized protein n=1 Tax=Cryphonectria parasitica (strain ATCC 38755 / EP155) TaxID=660469 RepID=A0A9P4XY51_CRYP1|nr:uncharacterized protein M406DRAFT_333270 [Cryphonectria parasitica EP155]KAF3762927.1 hypothetical protein M406DRAFT_333270 [Cryphonectria parasitica EP155]